MASRSLAIAFVAAVAVATGAEATDQLVFGKKLLLKNPASGTPGNKVVHLGKDPTIIVQPAGSAGDPQCSGAGGGGSSSLRILASGGAGDVTIPLPCAGWTTNGANDLYKYRDSSGATCSLVLVKAGRLAKAVCKGSHVTVDLNGTMAPVRIVTTLNAEPLCTEFGGTVVTKDGSDDQTFLHKDAAAPAGCPSTTTSTTSTTIPSCCNGQPYHSFATTSSTDDCGDVLHVSGALFADIACGGYYSGSGASSGPLPVTLPDRTQLVTAITACTGQSATLGPATSAETGSNRNCTAAGCLVGAPLPVVPAGLFLSHCIVRRVESGASGSLDCGSGSPSLSLPAEMDLYVSGDTAPDPGIQPCPRCVTGTCIGGPNDGLACTPGTSDLGDMFPTSHDCPPDPSDFFVTLPAGLSLTTGTVSWTATPATNDTGSTASSQIRVFSGYCRDRAIPDATGSFDASAAPGLQFKQCWENGMAVGTPCSEADNGAESCEQRDEGAFGPNGGANLTITVIGSPQAGILSGPAAGTLGAVFSMPPSFDGSLDAILDLPGPGAVAMPGIGELCVTATCPPQGPLLLHEDLTPCFPVREDTWEFDVIAGQQVVIEVDTIDPATAGSLRLHGDCAATDTFNTTSGMPCTYTFGFTQCPKRTLTTTATGKCAFAVTRASNTDSTCADDTRADYSLSVMVDGSGVAPLLTRDDALPCAGDRLAGACWYPPIVSLSCAAVCAGESRVYDDATLTFAGSAGTLPSCAAVIDLVDPGAAAPTAGSCPAGLGCVIHVPSLVTTWCTSPATTSAAAAADYARYCACE